MIREHPALEDEIITKEGKATMLFFLFTSEVFGEINDRQSTTVDLENIASNVNTKNKVKGKMILNTDTGATVFASGSAAGAVWHLYDSTTAHTPI